MNIIYLHIPKNGGTTLHQIIQQQYKKEEIFNVDLFDRDKSKTELLGLKEKDKEKIKVLKGGHIEFGWHQYLNNPNSYKYFTILRNPIDRALSFYYYAKRTPIHYLYDILNKKNITFEEFITNENWTKEISNGQTKMIAGVNQGEECSDSIYKQAVKNIEEQFFFIGYLEKYNETLFLLKESLNWSNVKYNILNENKNRDYQLSESTTKNIIELNFFDNKLYQKYLKEFDEKLSNFNELELNKFIISLTKTKRNNFLKRLINKLEK